jgi:hypothetical protein
MDDDYEDKGQNYEAEFGAFDRTVTYTAIGECIGGDLREGMTDEEKAKWHRNATPEQRFCLEILTFLKELDRYGIDKVPDTDIIKLINGNSKTGSLNPCGLVLGVYVRNKLHTHNGELNKNSLTEILKQLQYYDEDGVKNGDLPEFYETYGIEIEDIIRYARYAMSRL